MSSAVRFIAALLAPLAPLALAGALLAVPADEARADSGHPGGRYALHCAAGKDGDLAAVVHLLGSAHGIDVNARNGSDSYSCGGGWGGSGWDYTPLHSAAYYGRATIAATLIAAGAYVNAKNHFGETPLHKAAKYGHASVVSLLLSAGANVNAKGEMKNVKGNGGWTPLHVAAIYGHATIAAALIEAGAYVNATTDSGKTPLHWAALKGSAAAAAALIAAGAYVNATTNSGKTPLDLAHEKKEWDVAVVLEKHGARRAE